MKDSLGTGSLAHIYTHILFFSVFSMFSTVCLCVRASFVCAVTRPGHLRGIWGGVALCWKRGRGKTEACCCSVRQEKENGVQLLVVASYDEFEQRSRHYDSLTIAPSIQLESISIL